MLTEWKDQPLNPHVARSASSCHLLGETLPPEAPEGPGHCMVDSRSRPVQGPLAEFLRLSKPQILPRTSERLSGK